MAYLAGLRLDGRLVVVVGGGAVSRRRLPTLLAAGAVIRLVSPAVTPAVRALAEAGALTWVERAYEPGDLDGAWYVLAATDSPSVNALVARDAEAGRIFCVRADDASGGTAWTPATGEHDGVQVGVLGGRDPRRSAAVRDAVLAGLRTGSIAAARRGDKPVGVALVGGGPGDPDLITVRGRQLLAQADVVVADRLAPHALLAELPPHVLVVDAAKIPRGAAMSQSEINSLLISHARAGRFVVRLKGGDPYVFGRGYEEALACAAAGVPYTVVPGVTSAIAAPALAGVPVTHRGVAHEFLVVSGHLAPDDPGSLVDWEAAARLRGTLVLLMAMDRIDAIAAALIGYGRAADTPVAVVQEGGTPGQRVLRTVLSSAAAGIARDGLRAPAVIVIGDVAGDLS